MNIYDGGFLRSSFRKELIKVSSNLLPTIFSISISLHSFNHVSGTCHAQSIFVNCVLERI